MQQDSNCEVPVVTTSAETESAQPLYYPYGYPPTAAQYYQQYYNYSAYDPYYYQYYQQHPSQYQYGYSQFPYQQWPTSSSQTSQNQSPISSNPIYSQSSVNSATTNISISKPVNSTISFTGPMGKGKRNNLATGVIKATRWDTGDVPIKPNLISPQAITVPPPGYQNNPVVFPQSKPERFISPKITISSNSATPTSVPSQNNEPVKSSLPLALQDYCKRAYNSAPTQRDRDKITQRLSTIIRDAKAHGALDTIDWASEPLPIQEDKELELPRRFDERVIMSNSVSENKVSNHVNDDSSLLPSAYSNYNKSKKKIKKSKDKDERFRFGNLSPLYSSSSSTSPSLKDDSRSHRHISDYLPKNKYIKENRKNRKRFRNRSNSFSSSKSSNSDAPHDEPQKTLASTRGNGNNKRRKRNNRRGRGKKITDPEDSFFVPANNTNSAHPISLNPENVEALRKRADRFKDHLNNEILSTSKNSFITNIHMFNNCKNEEEMLAMWEDMKIVGTSSQLEKRYLRLNQAPDPNEVRPPHVLMKSLQIALDRWRSGDQSKEEYLRVNEQLKSIRQDLTVQCVRDEFTLEVYQENVHIALEAHDREEFSQCQSMLKQLEEEFHLFSDKRLEFMAYRIIYYLFSSDFQGLNTTLVSLKEHEKADEFIKFALSVRQSFQMQNYIAFFRLYFKATKYFKFLMEWLIGRVRIHALKALLHSYRPTVTRDFLCSQLGFQNFQEFENFFNESFSNNFLHFPLDDKLDCKQLLTLI